MKRRFAQFIAFCSWVAFILGMCGQAWSDVASDMSRPIVQVEVVSSLRSYSSSGSYAYFSQADEYFHFEQILKTSLEKMGDRFNFDIQRFPGRFKTDGLRLTIYLNEWMSDAHGEVRALFGVRIKAYDNAVNLGLFSGKSMLTPIPIQSLRDNVYADAMKVACNKFVKKLDTQLSKWGTDQLEVRGG